MSFNSRLGSSRVHRGRPSSKFHREYQGPPRPHEDAQPNELLRKRDASGPPAVRSSAPQYPRSWRGHHPSRGGGNAPSARRWSGQGPSAQIQPWDTLHKNTPSDTRSPFAVGPPNRAAVNHGTKVPLQDPFPPLPPADPVQGPIFDTERQGQPKTAEGNTAIIYHTASIASAGISGPSSRSTGWHPPKRRKVVRSDSRSHNHRFCESPPPAMVDVEDPSGIFRTALNDSTVSTHGQTSASAASAPVATSSESLASASDILFTDLTLPLDRNTVTPLIPIPKRLKTVPPSTAAPAHPPSSKSDNAVQSESPAIQEIHHSVPSTASSSTPFSALTTMRVKRERSPSPPLAPRLITEGCVRIAPLPPECRNRQPNFQAARQQLAAAEMKKLRALGLQIVRIFTREDGMVIDWKSTVPVLSDTLRPPLPPRLPPSTSGPKVFGVAPDTSPAGGAGTMQPPAPKPMEPQTTQTDPPVHRPKKRRKRKASSSSTHDGVVTKPSARIAAESMTDPLRVAGPSQSTAAPIVPPPTLAPPAPNKRQDPTPSQRAPAAAKKPAVRPSIPRPSSDVIDLREGGLLSFSVPASLSQAAGPIHGIPVPHLNAQLKPNQSSESRAIHQPPPTTGPSLSPPPNFARPTVLTASSTTLPSVRARIPPPSHAPVPPRVQAPAPPILIPARIPSPVPALALSPVHAPAPPVYIAQEELVDAALDFLERYLHTFHFMRPSLASAYAPDALFSLHTHTLEPEKVVQHAPQRGRAAILAALLSLPLHMTLCEWPPAAPTGTAHKMTWDVGCVPGSTSGDVLVACYAVQERKGKGKDKDKEREKEKPEERPATGLPEARTSRWSIEQRFILRRRDQGADGGGEDGRTAAAALWPLVAVSHQMRVRELP
ncbi:hypothetical protein V8D89_001869 [Ganoderma adspersum]